MKILILTDGISPFVIGGMQKHSFYLAKFLAMRDHEVTLVHCVPSGKNLPTQEETVAAMELSDNHLFKSIALHFPQAGVMPGHYLKESYQYSQNIYARIKEDLLDFDFVYVKGFAGWHLLVEKNKGTKMPPIGIKFHGYEMFQPPASFKSRIHHWLLQGPVKWNNKNSDFIFSYGGKITPLIESIGIRREKIIEIPTGIESNWLRKGWLPSKSDKVNFLFIGRFERRKGIEELNKVLVSLVDKMNFQFHFVGPIPPSKKIKSTSITYHGTISELNELQKILDTCQVLVVPSHSEGMPNVIMEGMARGLAIVATDVGAISVVVDAENGWLIKPASVDALEVALTEVINLGSDQLAIRQKNSLLKIQNFFWENVAKQVEDEIQRIIKVS